MKLSDVDWKAKPKTKTRIVKVLGAHGIHTLGDLTNLSFFELRRIWGLGEKSCWAIMLTLENHGLRLSGEEPTQIPTSISLKKDEWQRLA